MQLLLDQSLALAPWLSRIRRLLHQHPELAFQERLTARQVVEELRGLGLTQVQTGIAGTGVICHIGEAGRSPGTSEAKKTGRKTRRSQKEGPVIALRADMDALPIQDAKAVPYASTVEGVMHACGHDAHVAMLLGAAALLANWFAAEPGRRGGVRLLFQPAEEHHDRHGVSGAARMVREGALEGVDAIAALHVDSCRPLGEIATRPGPFSAAEDSFVARLISPGGHGAYPHLTRDPIWMLVPVLAALHGIVARRVDPLEPAVLTIGRLAGGTASNVIPTEVVLEGTIRCFSPDLREQLLREVDQALALSRGLGGDYSLSINRGYPPTMNDPSMVELLRQAVALIPGTGPVHDAPIGLGAEDFAYFAEKVPGVLAMIGAALPDGVTRAHHTPIFDIDERVLPLGAALLAQTAILFLEREAPEP